MSLARVAIVTGAARGIGRAISLRLARDGLDVVANDVPSKLAELEGLVAEIRATKQRGLAVVGDVSRETDVQKLVSYSVAKFGSLDVMIANAGIGRSSPIIATSVEEWDLIQATNARSAFLSYKTAAIQMIKQGRGGRIIGACSNAAKQGYAQWGPYGASKWAIRGLTQSAAAEWGQYGITVNAYAPGLVETQLLKDIEARRKQEGLEDVSMDPAWKIIQPDDVAGLVSYLVKEESRFITGQSVCINAGLYCD